MSVLPKLTTKFCEVMGTLVPFMGMLMPDVAVLLPSDGRSKALTQSRSRVMSRLRCIATGRNITRQAGIVSVGIPGVEQGLLFDVREDRVEPRPPGVAVHALRKGVDGGLVVMHRDPDLLDR